MNAVPALFDASTAPPVVSQGGAGQISGGLLRPGSIDQGQFLQMLQAQQSARQAVGVGGKPVMMPIQSFQDGIPTLTSAQFAALVGNQSDSSAPNPQGGAAIAAQPQPQSQASSAPTAATLKLSGTPLKPALDPGQSQPAAATSGDDSAASDVPMIYRAADPKITTMAAASPASAATSGTAAPAAAAATATQSAPPSDPRVVHLKQAPDRETQQALMAQGKRWIVDETPGSRQLFFGAKGTFGWKDFLDIINPLQHIPIVAQVYRAITGDQINGAAELIGAIPYGPLGVIGMMGAVADIAVKDVTGKDIGDNLEAMVFGNGTKGSGGDATATNAAATSSGVSPAANETSDSAAAASQPGSTQTADLAQVSANLEAARQMHNSARA